MNSQPSIGARWAGFPMILWALRALAVVTFIWAQGAACDRAFAGEYELSGAMASPSVKRIGKISSRATMQNPWIASASTTRRLLVSVRFHGDGWI